MKLRLAVILSMVALLLFVGCTQQPTQDKIIKSDYAPTYEQLKGMSNEELIFGYNEHIHKALNTDVNRMSIHYEVAIIYQNELNARTNERLFNAITGVVVK